MPGSVALRRLKRWAALAGSEGRLRASLRRAVFKSAAVIPRRRLAVQSLLTGRNVSCRTLLCAPVESHQGAR
jgi:hypothetical protein